jgi:hypothetical protein
MGQVTPLSLVLQIFLFHRMHNLHSLPLLIIPIPQFNLLYVTIYIQLQLLTYLLCQRNFNAPYPTPNLSAPRLYPTPQMLPPTWTARYPSQTALAPPESHTPSNIGRPLPRPLGGQPHQPPSRSTIPHSRSPATVTPRPVDSDSDLPEVNDIMHPNSKALGKRKARKDTDKPGEITRPSSKALSKRKAHDNTNEPPKKKHMAKDSKPGTSKAKVKAEPGSKAKQKGRSSGSCNFSSEEVHRLLRGINT